MDCAFSLCSGSSLHGSSERSSLVTKSEGCNSQSWCPMDSCRLCQPALLLALTCVTFGHWNVLRDPLY